MKSLEKLRGFKHYLSTNEAMHIADEIEREVSERYMELPVDADGVPWHIGDMTENRNVVNGIAFDRHGAHFISTLNDIDPGIHTHYKPRTLENVLCDMIHEYGSTDALTETIADKYAAEIRELLGGEGE